MRYQILFRAAPAWQTAKGEALPDDYAGKVISVKPEGHKWGPGDLRGARRVVAMDLTEEQYRELASGKLKLSPDGKTLLPVTFEDRWGALAAEIKKRLPDAEKYEVPVLDEKPRLEGEIWNATVSAAKATAFKESPRLVDEKKSEA